MSNFVSVSYIITLGKQSIKVKSDKNIIIYCIKICFEYNDLFLYSTNEFLSSVSTLYISAIVMVQHHFVYVLKL